MTDCYIRTVSKIYNGREIETLSPYKDITFKPGKYLKIDLSDVMSIYPDTWHKNGHIHVNMAQLCIELDGRLYVWKEMRV